MLFYESSTLVMYKIILKNVLNFQSVLSPRSWFSFQGGQFLGSELLAIDAAV